MIVVKSIFLKLSSGAPSSACVLCDDGVHLTKVDSNQLCKTLGLGVRIPVSKPGSSHTSNKTHLPRNYVRHSQQPDVGERGEQTNPHMQRTRKPRRSLKERPVRRPNNPDEEPLCDLCGVSGHLTD